MPKDIKEIRHFTSGIVSGIDPKDLPDDAFIWSQNVNPESILGQLTGIRKSKVIKDNILFNEIPSQAWVNPVDGNQQNWDNNDVPNILTIFNPTDDIVPGAIIQRGIGGYSSSLINGLPSNYVDDTALWDSFIQIETVSEVRQQEAGSVTLGCLGGTGGIQATEPLIGVDGGDLTSATLLLTDYSEGSLNVQCGDIVSGTGIAANTTVLSTHRPLEGEDYFYILLSKAVTGNINGGNVTFTRTAKPYVTCRVKKGLFGTSSCIEGNRLRILNTYSNIYPFLDSKNTREDGEFVENLLAFSGSTGALSILSGFHSGTSIQNLGNVGRSSESTIAKKADNLYFSNGITSPKWIGKVYGKRFNVEYSAEGSEMISTDSECIRPGDTSADLAAFTHIAAFPHNSTGKMVTNNSYDSVSNNSEGFYVASIRGQDKLYVVDRDSGSTYISQSLGVNIDAMCAAKSDPDDVKVWIYYRDSDNDPYGAYADKHPGYMQLIRLTDMSSTSTQVNLSDFSVTTGFEVTKMQKITIRYSTGEENEGNYLSTPFFTDWEPVSSGNYYKGWNQVTDIMETVDSSGRGRLWFLICPKERSIDNAHLHWFIPSFRENPAFNQDELATFSPILSNHASTSDRHLNRGGGAYTSFLFCSAYDVDAKVSATTSISDSGVEDYVEWSSAGDTTLYFDDKSVLSQTLTFDNWKTTAGGTNGTETFMGPADEYAARDYAMPNLQIGRKNVGEDWGTAFGFGHEVAHTQNCFNWIGGYEVLSDKMGSDGTNWGQTRRNGYGFDGQWTGTRWGSNDTISSQIGSNGDGTNGKLADDTYQSFSSFGGFWIGGGSGYLNDLTNNEEPGEQPDEDGSGNSVDWTDLGAEGTTDDFVLYNTHINANGTASVPASLRISPIAHSLVDVSDVYGIPHVVSYCMTSTIGERGNASHICTHFGFKVEHTDSYWTSMSNSQSHIKCFPNFRYISPNGKVIQCISSGGGTTNDLDRWLNGNRGGNSWYPKSMTNFHPTPVASGNVNTKGYGHLPALDCLSYKTDGADSVENNIRLIKVYQWDLPHGKAEFTSAKRNHIHDNGEDLTTIFYTWPTSSTDGSEANPLIGKTTVLDIRSQSGNHTGSDSFDLTDSLTADGSGEFTNQPPLICPGASGFDTQNGSNSYARASATATPSGSTITIAYDGKTGDHWQNDVGKLMVVDSNGHLQILRYTADSGGASGNFTCTGFANSSSTQATILDNSLILFYPDLITSVGHMSDLRVNNTKALIAWTENDGSTNFQDLQSGYYYDNLSILPEKDATSASRSYESSRCFDLRIGKVTKEIQDNSGDDEITVDNTVTQSNLDDLIIAEVWWKNSVNDKKYLEDDGTLSSGDDDRSGNISKTSGSGKPFYLTMINRTGRKEHFDVTIYDKKAAAMTGSGPELNDYVFGAQNDGAETYARFNSLASISPLIQIETNSTDEDSLHGSAFVRLKPINWKLSYVYDGYQESPLSLGTFTHYNETTSYTQLDLVVQIPSTLSPRITHLNIYRQDEPNGFYKLAFELSANDPRWGIRIADNGQEVFQARLTDVGDIGVSYEVLNEMSQNSEDTMVDYKISTIANDYLFVGKASHKTATNTDAYIYRSKGGKFSIFDWVEDYIILPQVPSSLTTFNGRVYAFDRNTIMRINPDTLMLEDIYEGAGCYDQNSVVSTPYGMFFADNYHIYMHNGSRPTVISDKIKVDASGKSRSWADLRNKFPIKMFFSPKDRSLYIACSWSSTFYGDNDEYNADIEFYRFSLERQRWDIANPSELGYSSINHFFTSLSNGTICGFNGPEPPSTSAELDGFLDGDWIYNSKYGSSIELFEQTESDTSFENPEFITRDFTMGKDTVDKMFIKIKLYGTMTNYPVVKIDGNECAHSATTDGNVTTLKLSPSSTQTKKGKKLQLDWSQGIGQGTAASPTHLDSIGIIFRFMSVK